MQRTARERLNNSIRSKELKLLNDFLLSLVVRSEDLIASREDEEGQTLIEYGLIIALISIVAIVALTLVGGNISNIFNSVAGKLHS